MAAMNARLRRMYWFMRYFCLSIAHLGLLSYHSIIAYKLAAHASLNCDLVCV
jgi:hypothetical protein